jgi:RHS repeat-associated protein
MRDAVVAISADHLRDHHLIVRFDSMTAVFDGQDRMVRRLDNAGSAWQTVATVSGNTKHIVRLAFAPVTTDRIRVIPADDASNGQTANDNLVSLTEIEVRSPAGAGQIRTQRFDAWGRIEQAAGSVPTYGFTGREPDATGLIHYRARYYHPELGRFVSKDPLGLSAGINPYAYADGNPVLFNDPDGLMAALAWNSANQYYNDFQVGTRVQGALQFGAGLGMGALGTGVGVTTGWTGLGAVGGGALIALGSDQMSAGFQTLVSGKSTPSLLNQGLQAAGASPTQAAWGEAAITIGASGGASLLSQGGRSFAQTAGVADDVFAAQGASELSFGRKLDFLFNKGIDQSNAYNAARAAGNAERIGIADTAANRAEVARLFNQAFRDPLSVVGPGKLPGSNVREFFLPGVTGTGSKIQFVEQGGKVITIIAK